jgi:hypothetical protein
MNTIIKSTNAKVLASGNTFGTEPAIVQPYIDENKQLVYPIVEIVEEEEVTVLYNAAGEKQGGGNVPFKVLNIDYNLDGLNAVENLKTSGNEFANLVVERTVKGVIKITSDDFVPSVGGFIGIVATVKDNSGTRQQTLTTYVNPSNECFVYTKQVEIDFGTEQITQGLVDAENGLNIIITVS